MELRLYRLNCKIKKIDSMISEQEQPKTSTGGQREEDEEDKQEEQGQMGEQTEDQEGTGQSESRTREDAHQGESSALVTQASASDQNDMKKPRKPGETNENRTLGMFRVVLMTYE